MRRPQIERCHNALRLATAFCIVLCVWLLYIERPLLFPLIVLPPLQRPLPLDDSPVDIEALVESWDPFSCNCQRDVSTFNDQRRYLFMLSDLSKREWITATKLAVMTLQMTCPRYGISVLWNSLIDRQHPNISSVEKAWFESRGVEIVRVLPRKVDPVRYNYIKLHVWEMVEYEMVALYDADMIFLHSPDSVFDACVQTGASFCAVRELLSDRVLLRFRKDLWWRFWQWFVPDQQLRQLKFKSFNAGAFVTRPNPNVAAHLFRRWVEGYKSNERAHLISEQLMLNHEITEVGWLSSTYNLQKASTVDQLRLGLWRTGMEDFPITVHRKYFSLGATYLRLLLLEAQRHSSCILPITL
ncbi:hypothetical protein QOT17_025130 [Balamuthia mandrillaris]